MTHTGMIARKWGSLFSALIVLVLLSSLAGPAIRSQAGAPPATRAQGSGWGFSLELSESWDVKPDSATSGLTGIGPGCWGVYANEFGESNGTPWADGTINKWGHIDESGNMTGGCHIQEGDSQDGRLFKGSVSGTFNPSSGAISNFHLDTTEIITNNIDGKISWGISTVTVDGSGGTLTPPDTLYTHKVDGKFTLTYKGSEGGDGAETGAVTLLLEIRSNGPSIQLDRPDAARFSALKLTGSGFQKGDNLKIMFNGVEIYQVDVMSDGSIPKDTWIWVPDDADFGVNKVWAEVKGKDTKSNTFELNVKELGREQLVSNFDEVVKQYLATVPRNERWYAFTRSGRVRNIGNAAGSVAAPVVWLVTTVFTLGFYRADIWPDNEFVCSDYQAKVLNFLDTLRFDPDPARRAFLDGLDYGPFNSGPAETPPGAHFFVVLWPHAAALDQAIVAAGFPSTWQTAGITFDPWPTQAPEIYEVKSGTGGWADTSIYSARWKIGSQYSYLLPRPEPPSFGYNKGAYPITGGKYYDPKGKGKLAADYRSIVGIGNEPPKMVVTHSPVTLEFTDAQGNKAGMRPGGELYDDIPGVELMVVQKDDGGYEWYAALPAGQIDVTITGTGAGSYQLLTKQVGQPIEEYPAVPVTAGATSSISLVDQTAPAPLHTADGQSLTPVEKPLPGGSTSPGKAPLISGLPSTTTLLAVGGVAGCGLVGIIVVVIGAVVLLGRRKAKARRSVYPAPLNAPSRVAQPPAGYPIPQVTPPRPQPPLARPVASPPPAVYPQRPPHARSTPGPVPVSPSKSPTPARLVVAQGSGSRPLVSVPPEGLTIGRDRANLLSLDDPEASRRHARLEFAHGFWFITDLNSANGVFVNGERVRRQALNHGDQILIGQTTLVFQIVP